MRTLIFALLVLSVAVNAAERRNSVLGAIKGAVQVLGRRELAELDTSQKGASIAPPPSLVKHTKK